MNHNHSTHPHSLRRRLGTLAAAGTVLSATGLAALLGVAGAANASEPTRETLPSGGIFGGEDTPTPPWSPISLPTIPTNPNIPVYTSPIIPLPDDDEPPIYVGPSIPLIPFDPSSPDTTGPQDTAAPVDTAPVDTPAPTDPPAPTPAPETPGSAPAGDVPPFLVITSATVDCAAILHVTFETGALPQVAPDAEHVVMFSPASNPAAVTAQRLVQRPQNGVFTLDMQSPVAEQYRVFVIADFEPANLEGVLLVDEADAPAPIDCPAPTPTG